MKKLLTFLLAVAITFVQVATTILTNVAYNALTAVAIAMVIQAPVVPVLIVAMLIGVSLGYAKDKFFITNDYAFAGLLKEIWISQLMEKFYSNWDWLTRSQDLSEHVNNNVINLADAGVDPTVLIDNTTYPVPVNERADAALALPLRYLDTENTVHRNVTEKQTSYNKMESIIKGHRNALSEKTAAMAGVNWAPSANGAYTPVFATTGTLDGVTSRRALKLADIFKMAKIFNTLKVPVKGRVMVLSPQHQADLQLEDIAIFKQFTNLRSGEVLEIAGFSVYMSQLNATYNGSTGARKALGAAAAPSTDADSTLFFHDSEVMKAEGSVDMFYQYKSPTERGDVVGFQKFVIVLPIRNKYIGAIYSALS